MLKYVSKFFLEIFPSVIATVVGAYIVNHYIIPRTGSDAPKAAYSKADPKAASKAAPKATPVDDQGAVDITPKSESTAQDVKGKPVDKAGAEKPAEAAKATVDLKRSLPREKVTAKSATAVPQAPPAQAPAAQAQPEAASPFEERRDANELARAAIERLRATAEPAKAETPRAATEAHVPDARDQDARAQEQARSSVTAGLSSAQPRAASVQPLPPPVSITSGMGPGRAGDMPASPSLALPPARSADADRLVPPADVPSPRPLDAEAAAPSTQKTSVADDVLSAARSVINAVVPQ